VPGVFYGENRPHGRGAYPRWSSEFEPSDRASSPTWRFRTDRTMNSAGHAAGRGAFGGGRNAGPVQPRRVGPRFLGGRYGGGASVHYPYREEPLRYVPFHLEGDAAEAPAFRITPGETVCFSFEVYAGAAGSRSLLRDSYDDDPASLKSLDAGCRCI